MKKRAVPKVVIMSATINASQLADYFGAGLPSEVPTLAVGSKLFPVACHGLEALAQVLPEEQASLISKELSHLLSMDNAVEADSRHSGTARGGRARQRRW